MASISGNVTVAGDPDDWIACAFNASTHAFAGVAAVSAGTYSITGLTAGVAYVVACRPKTGGVWIAESAGFAVGDYCIPTDPATDPYIFKCTAGSTSAARRYWRATSLTFGSGSTLEISELQLHSDAGNENANATKTSSISPSPGALSNLFDGSLSTSAYWTSFSGSQSIKWDFGGTDKLITGIKIGAYDTASRYPSGITVQSSPDDTNWTTIATISGLSYPGNNTLSALLSVATAAYTGASEPTWPTTPGNTVVDEDMTWTNMGQMVRPLMHGPLIAV